MNDKITKIEMGKPFKLFDNNMKGQTGCVTEMLENGVFCLVIYMDNMTFEEVIILNQIKVKVKAIKETDDFLLIMIKFGNTPLIFEIAFDPTLYNDSRREYFMETNMLSIIGVDSNSNIIKALRYVSMPLALHNLYKDAWSLALKREGFSTKYTKWVDDLDKRYSIYDLWKIGKNYGEMGQQEWE